MSKTPRGLVGLAIVTGLALAGVATAHSDEWPSRPIRLVVPFTAGSSSDIVARIVAQRLGERLGQSVVIDNRVGAGGNVGTEAVARADPDGYTLGLATATTHAVTAGLSAALPYDPVRDFAPISMIGSSPFVLAVFPALPAKDIRELIALAKAKPRALNYASAGPTTLAHLSGVLFEKMAGIELTHVPYRGTAQSTLDLLEGRVEMSFSTIPPSLVHLREGKLRAMATTGATRTPALPDTPTMAESGLPGYESALWQSIAAPAKTPPAIIARLNREIVTLLGEPEVRASLAKQGVEAEPGTPDALAARIRADIEKWRDVIRGAGISDR
jgi:tripartite-type tricarboxylate transporter receptor subunit TctC